MPRPIARPTPICLLSGQQVHFQEGQLDTCETDVLMAWEGGVWTSVRVAIGELEGLTAMPITFVSTRIGSGMGIYVLLGSCPTGNVV